MFKNLFGRKPNVTAAMKAHHARMADVVRGIIEAKRAAEPDAQFYAYVLSDATDWAAPGFSMMSEDRYAALLEKHADWIERSPNYHVRDELRWGFWEWGKGAELIDDGDALWSLKDRAAEILAPHYTGYLLDKGVAEAMMHGLGDVLAQLDDAGVFGTGAARDKVMIYPFLDDAGVEYWTYEMGQRLNPPGAWALYGDSFGRAFNFQNR